ncbi:hypothetical protein LTR37_004690 [Vermiconidia calcicola]|uniref:Uncharacterized protein n=1 Tax=Vermiconidia calcicola TaxID=1690605 RepID=A0ACC3NLZ4_9PEZI|nr:hypothetical protein LTR37_004690 [Vermiconidia calcicola]
MTQPLIGVQHSPLEPPPETAITINRPVIFMVHELWYPESSQDELVMEDPPRCRTLAVHSDLESANACGAEHVQALEELTKRDVEMADVETTAVDIPVTPRTPPRQITGPDAVVADAQETMRTRTPPGGDAADQKVHDSPLDDGGDEPMDEEDKFEQHLYDTFAGLWRSTQAETKANGCKKWVVDWSDTTVVEVDSHEVLAKGNSAGYEFPVPLPSRFDEEKAQSRDL